MPNWCSIVGRYGPRPANLGLHGGLADLGFHYGPNLYSIVGRFGFPLGADFNWASTVGLHCGLADLGWAFTVGWASLWDGRFGLQLWARFVFHLWADLGLHCGPAYLGFIYGPNWCCFLGHLGFPCGPIWAFPVGRPIWASTVARFSLGHHCCRFEPAPPVGRFEPGLLCGPIWDGPIWAYTIAGRFGLPLWAILGFHYGPNWCSTVGRFGFYCGPIWAGPPIWADFGFHCGPTYLGLHWAGRFGLTL